MVTADQIVAHLVGDYILQSDWMAQRKLHASTPALVHALCYSLPFLFFHPSLVAWGVIVTTHFAIDRWRLARYVVWAKNFIAPRHLHWCPDHTFDARGSSLGCVKCATVRVRPFGHCAATGYDPDRPAWLAVWLMIIADNTLHLLCNGVALKWL